MYDLRLTFALDICKQRTDIIKINNIRLIRGISLTVQQGLMYLLQQIQCIHQASRRETIPSGPI